jgi:hypothetical protein
VLAYDFTEIASFGAKNYWNSVFLGRGTHIPDWLYIAGPYMSFFFVLKKWFFLKIHKCYPTVLLKITNLGQKQIETPYFLVVIGIWRIGYT